MTGSHCDPGPELRQLAQTILDRLDPAIRAAAASVAGRGPGRCQQVWCPVCALAAVANGEQHPLLNVVAEHSMALLAIIRALVADGTPPPDTDGPAAEPEPGSPPGPGRYEHIPFTVEE